jgi:nickel superoxide dismutase
MPLPPRIDLLESDIAPSPTVTAVGRVGEYADDGGTVNLIERLLQPRHEAHAHCDLFCGVYDPAQAKIDAMSCLKAAEKYQASDDDVFRSRCIMIKEAQADLVKHHLSVLWTDFFKPHHLEQFPDLHDLFWRAIKSAGEAKKSMDPAVSQAMVDLVDEVSAVFWQTAESATVGLYPPA